MEYFSPASLLNGLMATEPTQTKEIHGRRLCYGVMLSDSGTHSLEYAVEVKAELQPFGDLYIKISLFNLEGQYIGRSYIPTGPNPAEQSLAKDLTTEIRRVHEGARYEDVRNADKKAKRDAEELEWYFNQKDLMMNFRENF